MAVHQEHSDVGLLSLSGPAQTFRHDSLHHPAFMRQHSGSLHSPTHEGNTSGPLRVMRGSSANGGPARQHGGVFHYCSSMHQMSGIALSSFGEDAESSSSDEEACETLQLLAAMSLAQEQSPRYRGMRRNSSWSMQRLESQGSGKLPRVASKLSVDMNSVPHHSVSHQQDHHLETTQDSESDTPPAIRLRNGYHLTNSNAAVELFLRLGRARQTVEYSKRQAALFAPGTHGVFGVWEAMQLLNELREYEAVLMKGATEEDASSNENSSQDNGPGPQPMSMLQHAYQSGELARLHFPDKDYLHLAAFIHGLGKLLAHNRWGSQPQWSVTGETFPVGCRFSNLISGSKFFSVNPDRRRRLYSSLHGCYTPQCGLKHVTMSWGGPEYLYNVLCCQCGLPAEALFCIRHQRFQSLTAGDCYWHLCDEQDMVMLPTLQVFQEVIEFKPRDVPIVPGHELQDYYQLLMRKYLPEKLAW